jgi:hypothetical protein
MVICFKCSSSTKRKLDDLLGNGTFADYSEIVTAAIDSFSVLYAEVQHKGSVVVGEVGATSGLALPSQPPGPSDPPQASDHSVGTQAAGSEVLAQAPEREVTRRTVPTLFTRSSVTEVPGELGPTPPDVFFAGQAVPVDRWIFGQFSKLLPAKASCRGIANLYPPPSAGFEIEKIASKIAKEAALLGGYLSARDRESESARDDAWAIGFPSGESKADRSRLRYANQFVGSIGKQGTLTGLLIDLKLINLAKHGTKRILLTRAGWDFAQLENPVLDGIHGEGKFSNAEVAFLLEHIRRHVPVEDFAVRTLLAAMRTGSDTPEKLDVVCREHIPVKRRKEVTDAVVTTQRTGAISRMVDLGLVARRRDGVRVSYVVTEQGNRYADQPVAA